MILTGWSTLGSGPCTSSGQHSRIGPRCGGLQVRRPKGISAEELSLPPVCWAVAWTKERCQPPPSCCWPSMAGRKAGPQVMRVGELTMCVVTHCDPQESGLCISPGSRVELALTVGVTGELSIWHESRKVRGMTHSDTS